VKNAAGQNATADQSSLSSSSDEETGDFGFNIVGGMRIKELDNDLEVY
jgi:hypothetical protein